jgi:hypothetical protein
MMVSYADTVVVRSGLVHMPGGCRCGTFSRSGTVHVEASHGAAMEHERRHGYEHEARN